MKSSLSRLGVLPELKSLGFFQNMPDTQIENLCKNGSVVVTEHREALFTVGEPAPFFYFVLSGAYKLTKPTPLGEESILHFSPPGDVIAAFIMTQQDPKYPLSAISMGPSRALKIPRSNYLNAWVQDPHLILSIQRLLSSRMAALQSQKVLSKSPLQAKIASFLIDLADKQDSTSQTIPLPLTRKEIADSVDASVESIIRIMSEWSKKGYISTTEKQITIIRADKVIQLMNSES